MGVETKEETTRHFYKLKCHAHTGGKGAPAKQQTHGETERDGDGTARRLERSSGKL